MEKVKKKSTWRHNERELTRTTVVSERNSCICVCWIKFEYGEMIGKITVIRSACKKFSRKTGNGRNN